MFDRVVGAEHDGSRIDAVLAEWSGASRGAAQGWIAAGAVQVNGRPATAKSLRVSAGDRVTAAPDETGEQPSVPPPPPVVVRYEDDDLAVVVKPAGLIVHAGSGTRGSATLVDTLRSMQMPLAESDDPTRPGIVHRLDRGTSGLLVVAKTEAARTALVATFKRHDIDRRYWALVDGVPDPPSATIDAPITRSNSNRTKFTVGSDGRRAVTHYDVIEAFGRASLLTVRLETGRTHQVRVHLSAVGHPVAGDRTYGASTALRNELGLQRPALHAARLGFDHPRTGRRIVVDEPIPQDLDSAYQQLG